MKHLFKITGAALCLILMLSACALISTENTGARLSVKIGVMKAIEAAEDSAGRHARAETIIRLSDYGQTLLDDQTLALAVVYDRVYAEIPWQKLEPSDRYLYQFLLSEVRDGIRDQIRRGDVDADATVTVRVALRWIREAAVDYQAMLKNG